jgi:hypothetical protein
MYLANVRSRRQKDRKRCNRLKAAIKAKNRRRRASLKT